jgi:hypothetical protein
VRDEARLSFGGAIKAMGSRARGAGLLLFALPETILISLPGVSVLLAIPFVLIATHLIAFGEGGGPAQTGAPPDPARLGVVGMAGVIASHLPVLMIPTCLPPA